MEVDVIDADCHDRQKALVEQARDGWSGWGRGLG